jgi:hypothetical protein
MWRPWGREVVGGGEGSTWSLRWLGWLRKATRLAIAAEGLRSSNCGAGRWMPILTACTSTDARLRCQALLANDTACLCPMVTTVSWSSGSSRPQYEVLKRDFEAGTLLGR